MPTKVLFRFPLSENEFDQSFHYIEGVSEYLSEDLIIDNNDYFIIRPFERNNFPLALNANDSKLLSKCELKDISFELPKSSEEMYFASKAQYMNIVQEGLDYIKDEIFRKIVPARVNKWDHNFNNSVDLINYFIKLSDTFPNAFVYLIQSDQFGCWMGASPELLLSANDSSLKTISLAGTRTESQLDKNQIFTKKEENEQSIVTDYIQNILNDYCDNIHKQPATMFHHNNLIHLRTIIEADWKTDMQYQSSFLSLAESLHPTPAIAGFPTDKALSFLQTKEGYQRELYAGYLGLFRKNEESKLFVNLRCMKLNAGFGFTFAGAGVVEGSDPESEFEETEKKMEAILSADPQNFTLITKPE